MRQVLVPTFVLAALLTGVAATAAETLSARTYQRLQDVQASMDAGRTDEAITALESLAGNVSGRAYDYAMVMQYLAHAHMVAERTDAALTTVQTALARPDAPADLALELRFYEAKLLLAAERYREGLASLERWFADAAAPTEEALYYRGFALFQLERYDEAQQALENAVSLAPVPPESWKELLLAACVQAGDMRRAETLLKRWVDESPHELRHWNRLASVYVELDDEASALATLMLASRLHTLPPAELDRIVALHGLLDMPEKAARLLEDWIERGRLEPSPARQRQLADLWLLARERDRAKAAFAQAAEAAGDGELDRILGSLHMEDGEWKAAADALARALERGGLDDAARTRLLLGVSHLKAGNVEAAVSAFTEAARAPAVRATADYWLRVATAESERPSGDG